MENELYLCKHTQRSTFEHGQNALFADLSDDTLIYVSFNHSHLVNNSPLVMDEFSWIMVDLQG